MSPMPRHSLYTPRNRCTPYDAETSPPSFQRKLEPSAFGAPGRRWIPAFAGMTAEFRLHPTYKLSLTPHFSSLTPRPWPHDA